MKNLKNYLFYTSSQRVLFFLAENIQEEFTEKEISASTGVKKSAVNLALRQLYEERIIEKKQVGRSSLYSANENNHIIREIKILQNILELSTLVKKLKLESQKIILFGSMAAGTNTKESDIDVFVQSNNPVTVRRIIDSSPLRKKIQLIVKTPKEMILVNKNKPLFFQEIEGGKKLWEKYEKQ